MQHTFFSFLIILFMVGCNDEPRTKLFVKSVPVNGQVRIDWYVHSSIGGYAPDYLQISTSDKKPFFYSFFLTDIRFKNDSLYISLWKNDYEIEQSMLGKTKVFIDTNGHQWNGAADRIDRLLRRGVNIREPNFIDTYCLRGGCK